MNIDELKAKIESLNQREVEHFAATGTAQGQIAYDHLRGTYEVALQVALLRAEIGRQQQAAGRAARKED
jgi:hypothetical protein